MAHNTSRTNLKRGSKKSNKREATEKGIQYAINYPISYIVHWPNILEAGNLYGIRHSQSVSKMWPKIEMRSKKIIHQYDNSLNLDFSTRW